MPGAKMLCVLTVWLLIACFYFIFVAIFPCVFLEFIIWMRARLSRRSSRHGIPNNIEQFTALQRALNAAKKKKHLTCCRRRRENWRERDSHSLFRLEPNILKSCLRSAFAILLILIFVIYFQRFGCCSLFVNSQQPA